MRKLEKSELKRVYGGGNAFGGGHGRGDKSDTDHDASAGGPGNTAPGLSGDGT